MQRTCELEHTRPAKAVVRVIVKSSRIGTAGRAIVRETSLCRSHAEELRRLGFEIVSSS